jgi:hypothetical protein
VEQYVVPSEFSLKQSGVFESNISGIVLSQCLSGQYLIAFFILYFPSLICRSNFPQYGQDFMWLSSGVPFIKMVGAAKRTAFPPPFKNGGFHADVFMKIRRIIKKILFAIFLITCTILIAPFLIFIWIVMICHDRIHKDKPSNGDDRIISLLY